MGKLIGVAVLALLLVGAWYGGKFLNDEVVPVPEGQGEASKEGVIVTGPTIPQGQPVTNITGRILSILGDTLTMTADAPLGMSDDATLQERTVTLTDATTVNTFVERDPELVKQEMEALKARIAENERVAAEARAAGANIPPMPVIEIPEVVPVVYDQQVVGREKLAAGQVVGVTAGADIRTEKDFTAVSIDILISSPTP